MESIHSLLPTNNVVIYDINDEFHDAIQHLRKQDIVGLALEEPDCDRYGDLEWLSVSTSMCTFMFDIQRLQKNAFSEGLKTVLENPRIVKVVHDCRRPSDCLFHQYNTKLSNIYDTQVADFITNVQKLNPLNISKTVNTLYHCLSSYLQIPEEFFNPRPNKSDYSFRPLKLEVKDFLIKNVIYLRLLKKELDVVLRIPYRRCVDIYMQSILKKSDGEMKLCPPELATVPPEMLIEGMQFFQITEKLPDSTAFLQKKEKSENYQLKYEESGYGNIIDYNISRDFDRTEVIKFLMERMFYGRNFHNGAKAHSVQSDQCSVKSADVSSLCDSVCHVKKSNDVNINLSTLSRLKGLPMSNDSNQQLENQSLSDTSSVKGRSEKSLAMSKTIDLVRHFKLKSVPQKVDEKPKQSKEGSSVKLERDSPICSTQPAQEETNQSKRVNNLTRTSNIPENMEGENLISIITSKDISPSDKYKYIMSNRSKTSSKKSSISESNDHLSSKYSDQSCSFTSNSNENANKTQALNEDLSEVMIKESDIVDYDQRFSPISEPDNVSNVDDPWEKLRTAFDGLGPQKPSKKTVFVPAGMNY